MARRQRNSALTSSALELIAGGISDPILRLRFLKRTAPAATGHARSRGWIRTAAIAVSLSAMLTTVLVVRAGAPPKPALVGSHPLESPRAALSTLPAPPNASPDVWKVDDSRDFETYSNGLRIDDRFAISNHPRSYLVFPAGEPRPKDGVPANRPAGIVFHTTESHQAPFEPGQNRVLQRIEESLVEYVQQKRAYHFLIDRFGRVYRVVAETDAANHAGYSVWANDSSVYVNLNESFLGVSFEAETQPGQMEPSVSPAQVRAAAMLTEMLRSRYAIPAVNCVTHAQVSVNPANMRVGYHTDWASSFPFEQLGLPNNYAHSSVGVSIFGFEYDSGFLHWAGSRLYSGIESAEQQFRESAREAGMTQSAYRTVLQKRYRQRLNATHRGVPVAETGSE